MQYSIITPFFKPVNVDFVIFCLFDIAAVGQIADSGVFVYSYDKSRRVMPGGFLCISIYIFRFTRSPVWHRGAARRDMSLRRAPRAMSRVPS